MTKQENIKQMRERHKTEMKDLQKTCPHTSLSKWEDWFYAPGHWGGRVRICKDCGKVIGRSGPLVIKE